MINSLIPLPQFADERGTLVAVHGEKEIPFAIQRIFYIYNVDLQVRRGLHAHKTSKQVLICLKGSCRVALDDGMKQLICVLDDPNQGLFIDHGIWLEMNQFSTDCLLLVLSSTSYNPEDTIDNYQDFLKYRKDLG